MGSVLASEAKPPLPVPADLKRLEELPKPEDFGYFAVPDIEIHTRSGESNQEKLLRKCKENPFVPLGLTVTVFALVRGILTLRGGTGKQSQQMMRLRVAAQGFTVLAVLAGAAYSSKDMRLERQVNKAEREALAEVLRPALEAKK